MFSSAYSDSRSRRPFLLVPEKRHGGREPLALYYTLPGSPGTGLVSGNRSMGIRRFPEAGYRPVGGLPRPDENKGPVPFRDRASAG